jgi:hypothetical protein
MDGIVPTEKGKTMKMLRTYNTVVLNISDSRDLCTRLLM